MRNELMRLRSGLVQGLLWRRIKAIQPAVNGNAALGAFLLVSLALLAAKRVYGAEPNLPRIIWAANQLPSWDWYRSLDPQRVVDACSKSIKDNPKLPDKQRADLHLNRAEAYVALGKLELAKQDYDEALKYRPNDRDVTLNRAAVLLQLRRIKVAKADVAKLIECWPKFGPAYGLMAGISALEDDTEEAIRLASRCLELDATYVQAYLLRAQLYFDKNQFRQCLADINRCIELEPAIPWRPAEPYLLRGRVLAQLGRFREAVVNFHMVRRMNRKSSEATFELSRAYLYLGKSHLALCIAEEFVKQDEKAPHGYALLASCLNRVRKPEQAIKATENAVKLDSNNAVAHREWGCAAMLMGNYDVAIEHYNKSLRLNPNSVLTMTGTAHLLATCPVDRIRDGKRAKELAAKVCKGVEWGRGNSLVVLAEAQAECGEFNAAKKSLEEALKITADGSAEWKESVLKKMKLFEQGKPFREEKPSAKKQGE